jgi:hypothetical protein
MLSKKLARAFGVVFILLGSIQSAITTGTERKRAPTIGVQSGLVNAPTELIKQIGSDSQNIKACLEASYQGDAAQLAMSVDVEQRDLNRGGRPEFLIVFKDMLRQTLTEDHSTQ